MNYKELFNRTVLLMSSPAKAWTEIEKEEEEDIDSSEEVASEVESDE